MKIMYRTLGLCASLMLTASMLPAQAQTILRFSHTDQQQGARQQAIQEFANRVEKYTDGRYKVQIFCCSQLGNDPKSIEQTALGGVDFTISGTGSYASYVPTLDLTALPFIFSTYAQGWKFYDTSPWLAAQYAKAPAKGFRFLATWEAGFRDLTTKKPVNSPADAKGMKLRTFPNEMMRWTLEAMGFGIQIMPLPEVYLAIQQGAVSGQENPIDTIFSNKFYEVAPNITLTNHVYSPLPVVISEKTWKRLSPEDQKAVARAAAEVTPISRKLVTSMEDDELAQMEAKGAIVNRTPDLEAFREAVKPVYEKARAKFGSDVDTVLKEAAAIRAEVK